MPVKTNRLGILAGLLIWIYSCAIQIAPQGGDKDTKPPELERVNPPDMTTGFISKEIEFTFDEFIQLKDLPGQLIVSPPLKNAPVPHVRKNRLILDIEDTLRPNSTYTFNFGNAVGDLNEGNPLTGLQYVISTGSVIDTLSISGSVLRGEDLKPEKGMMVMLYPSGSDSLPYQERPYYFSKTSESGQFSIRYVAPGLYRVFALSESNGNYIYDDPDERIAFIDSLKPAPQSDLKLFSFRKKVVTQFVRAGSEEYGSFKFVFTGDAKDVRTEWLVDTAAAGFFSKETSERNDTVVYWYENDTLETVEVVLHNASRSDSVNVRLIKRNSPTMKRRGFQLNAALVSAPSELQHLNQPVTFQFNHPLRSLDLSKIRLTVDSLPVAIKGYSFLDSIHRKVALHVDWQEAARYRMTILDGAFTDRYGLINDTIELKFSSRELTDYATLKTRLSGLPSEKTWIVQLVTDAEAVVRSTAFSGDTVVYYDFLMPGVYRLKLIEDRNGNGLWDAGNDLQHLQPEAVLYYKDLVPLRANWDVEISWKKE